MKTSIAIVGEYQIGKSTLLNCLLKSHKAATGRGCRTTAENRRYELTPFVDLVDTPGFDANAADDATASSAVRDASAFVFVMKAKTLGDKDKEIIRKIFKTGRRCIFVYNCNNAECWDPEDENNREVCETIEADLKSSGFDSLGLQVNGKPVFMVNELWELYGLGVLQGVAESENGEEVKIQAKRVVRQIESFIKRELDGVSPERYREEMLRRSNVGILRDFLEEMPLHSLAAFARDISNEIERMSDCFLEALQKRCKECADGIKKFGTK